VSFVSREEELTLERIQKLIGSKITRIIKPGFEVSNRVSLLKSISRKVVSGRSNKASETFIELGSSGNAQPKGKPRRSKPAHEAGSDAAKKPVARPQLKKPSAPKKPAAGNSSGRGKRAS
jgi:hypothetical protein